VLLLENLDTLAKTACAWTLTLEGLCGNGLNGGHEKGRRRRKWWWGCEEVVVVVEEDVRTRKGKRRRREEKKLKRRESDAAFLSIPMKRRQTDKKREGRGRSLFPCMEMEWV
jgi:hypothetical protein